tara:strand:+ start:1989 stop:2300 length:312 start_codon:yes stop_codon:yes gene_type:complete
MRLSQFVNVKPMNTRGGNPSPNQCIMSDPHGETFVSYGTKICYRSFDLYGPERRPKYVFDEYYWNYSRTTGKYRNEFLGMGVQECRKGIKEGWIKLTDLNKKK